MQRPSDYHEIPITILDADIDVLNHVNNVVYLRWVQEAAISHWKTLAHPDDQKDLFWVVARHEIDYLKSAFRGDKLLARTWVGSARGRSFDRHTEIVRMPEEAIIAKTRTVWVPISVKTGKPTEVNERVRSFFSR